MKHWFLSNSIRSMKDEPEVWLFYEQFDIIQKLKHEIFSMFSQLKSVAKVTNTKLRKKNNWRLYFRYGFIQFVIFRHLNCNNDLTLFCSIPHLEMGMYIFIRIKEEKKRN